MKIVFVALISISTIKPIINKGLNNETNNQTEKLTVLKLNTTLLNKIVFQLVNDKRRKKGLDTLEFNFSLNEVALNYQNEFEFRRFKNTTSVERKIKKSLNSKTKKAGFDGGLVLPILAECEALDYDRKTDYFLDRNNKDSEFKLFYGKKPRKSEKNPERKSIEALNYFTFAKKLLKNLDSENKKQLYAKAYKWGGVNLQWYYKSLNKRKIPQIKMIFILGGYATYGMR